MNIFDFLKPKSVKKPLVLIDGDSLATSPFIVDLLKPTMETYWFQAVKNNMAMPKFVKNAEFIYTVALAGCRTGKEAVDKYIGMVLTKAIIDGYTEIYIVSQDYDFIEIARMAAHIVEPKTKVSIKVVCPAKQAVPKDVNIAPVNSPTYSIQFFKVKPKKIFHQKK